jgi:mRNA interferase MazF
MKRGEVYYASFGLAEDAAQAGVRPVVIISRDVINASSPVVLVAPCTSYRGQRIYPSQVLIRAPDGGLDIDSVAMAELVRPIVKEHLGQLRGTLSQSAMAGLERALRIALDLP